MKAIYIFTLFLISSNLVNAKANQQIEPLQIQNVHFQKLEDFQSWEMRSDTYLEIIRSIFQRESPQLLQKMDLASKFSPINFSIKNEISFSQCQDLMEKIAAQYSPHSPFKGSINGFSYSWPICGEAQFDQKIYYEKQLLTQAFGLPIDSVLQLQIRDVTNGTKRLMVSNLFLGKNLRILQNEWLIYLDDKLARYNIHAFDQAGDFYTTDEYMDGINWSFQTYMDAGGQYPKVKRSRFPDKVGFSYFRFADEIEYYTDWKNYQILPGTALGIYTYFNPKTNSDISLTSPSRGFRYEQRYLNETLACDVAAVDVRYYDLKRWDRFFFPSQQAYEECSN